MHVGVDEWMHMPIRARCAFVLIIAELLVNEMPNGAAGGTVARNALSVAYAWLDGGNVSADQLCDLLMDPNDQGIYAHIDRRVKRPTDEVYSVLGGAICYLAWHAYRLKKAMLPTGMDACNEDYVQWILNEASKSPAFNADKAGAVLSYLQKQFVARDGEDFGDRIDADVLRMAISG